MLLPQLVSNLVDWLDTNLPENGEKLPFLGR